MPDHALDELTDRLAATAGPAATRSPPGSVGGGAFPHPDRARVALGRARGRLRRALPGAPGRPPNAAGAVVDGQRFRPHLTLARLGSPANVSRWVRLLDTYAGPSWKVDEVALVASYLGEGPRRGPRHEVVATLPLG